MEITSGQIGKDGCCLSIYIHVFKCAFFSGQPASLNSVCGEMK